MTFEVYTAQPHPDRHAHSPTPAPEGLIQMGEIQQDRSGLVRLDDLLQIVDELTCQFVTG